MNVETATATSFSVECNLLLLLVELGKEVISVL